VVCGIDLLSRFDLVPQPIDQKPSVDAIKRIKEVQKLREQVKGRIEKASMSYQAQLN